MSSSSFFGEKCSGGAFTTVTDKGGTVERGIEERLDECPRCGNNSAAIRMKRDTFLYGTGESAAELSVLVPVHTCSVCGFEYTDAVAEEARHEAVCQHLGLLAPRQIV